MASIVHNARTACRPARQLPKSPFHANEESDSRLRGTKSFMTTLPPLQDNILFGAAFEEARYRKALAACALDADVAALPAGDMTELGERGINLSGDFDFSFPASGLQAVHPRAGSGARLHPCKALLVQLGDTALHDEGLFPWDPTIMPSGLAPLEAG